MARVIHDISLALNDQLPRWPGDPKMNTTLIASLDAGDEANVTAFSMCAHTGTHVDAPSHYLKNGATVDELDLSTLVGPAWVTHAVEADAVSAEVLEALDLPRDIARLLVRTRNSDRWLRGESAFDPDFVAITPDGARWMVDHGVQVVGIDYLSVASCDQTTATHVILLEAGLIPLEGLNLSGVTPGSYDLVCLPLCLAGADGAPARAILVASDDQTRCTCTEDAG